MIELVLTWTFFSIFSKGCRDVWMLSRLNVVVSSHPYMTANRNFVHFAVSSVLIPFYFLQFNWSVCEEVLVRVSSLFSEFYVWFICHQAAAIVATAYLKITVKLNSFFSYYYECWEKFWKMMKNNDHFYEYFQNVGENKVSQIPSMIPVV